jgi:hypothetical protein
MSGRILTGIYNAGKKAFVAKRQCTPRPNQRSGMGKSLTITTSCAVALSAATEWQKKHDRVAKSPGCQGADRNRHCARAPSRPGTRGGDVPLVARLQPRDEAAAKHDRDGAESLSRRAADSYFFFTDAG